MEKYDVIVLGAGLAGLACADEILANSQKRVLVIEKNNFVGGLAATFAYKNFHFDLAPHRWITKNKELNLWLNKLLGSNLISIEKYTPMYQFGRFYHYPIEIGDVLKKNNFFMNLALMGSYLFEKGRSLVKPRKIVTMEDAYIERFGYALYKWFNEEFNQKLYGGCDQMSADFVNQRVKNLSFRTAILNSLGIGKEKVISLEKQFLFPKDGIGTISQRLAQRIQKHGGEVRLNEEVSSIEKRGDKYLLKTNQSVYETGRIVSSIPIDVLVNHLKIKEITPIQDLVNKLHYVHQKIVVLFANKDRLTNFTWVYIHPKNIKAFRFMETNNWSPTMSPKDKTSLVFEYPYEKGGEIEKMTDANLVEITVNDFLSYFAPPSVKRSDITGGKVFRVPNAYPKYDLSYQGPLTKVKNFISKNLPGMILIGRNGMFHYNNMDHSVYTGILAARNILEGKNIYNLEKVNNEAEYLEEIKKDR